MSPVATETPTPGWGLGPTPAYTVIYTGKLHHDRGRYPEAWLADTIRRIADHPARRVAELLPWNYRPV